MLMFCWGLYKGASLFFQTGFHLVYAIFGTGSLLLVIWAGFGRDKLWAFFEAGFQGALGNAFFFVFTLFFGIVVAFIIWCWHSRRKNGFFFDRSS